jgi:DNA repair ATPase RecN
MLGQPRCKDQSQRIERAKMEILTSQRRQSFSSDGKLWGFISEGPAECHHLLRLESILFKLGEEHQEAHLEDPDRHDSTLDHRIFVPLGTRRRRSV